MLSTLTILITETDKRNIQEGNYNEVAFYKFGAVEIAQMVRESYQKEFESGLVEILNKLEFIQSDVARLYIGLCPLYKLSALINWTLDTIAFQYAYGVKLSEISIQQMEHPLFNKFTHVMCELMKVGAKDVPIGFYKKSAGNQPNSVDKILDIAEYTIKSIEIGASKNLQLVDAYSVKNGEKDHSIWSDYTFCSMLAERISNENIFKCFDNETGKYFLKGLFKDEYFLSKELRGRENIRSALLNLSYADENGYEYSLECVQHAEEKAILSWRDGSKMFAHLSQEKIAECYANCMFSACKRIEANISMQKLEIYLENAQNSAVKFDIEKYKNFIKRLVYADYEKVGMLTYNRVALKAALWSKHPQMLYILLGIPKESYNDSYAFVKELLGKSMDRILDELGVF